MSELAYSSAKVDMLDRETQTVKGTMLYPITKVELLEFRGNAIVTARTFVVDEHDRWVEQQ